MLPQIMLTDEDFQRIQHAKEDPRLVYIVDILEDGGIRELSPDDGEPLMNLLFNMSIISLSVDWLQSS